MSIKEPPQLEINSIIALFSSGLFQEALDKVVSLTKNFPENPILHNITGACFAGLGQFKSAVKSYQKALFIKPDYSKAHYNLGGTFQELGKLEDSVKSYENSIEFDPDYAEAHNNLGNVFRELGELNMAIKSYENALAINPNYAEAHFSLSIVLQDFGQIDLMIEHLQKVVALNPDLAEGHHSLGVGLKELGRLDDAVKSYHKALLLNPNFFEAHNNLGNAFKELGQLDDAVSSYEKALKINPDYPSIYNNLGNSFKDLGQLSDAVKSYERAIAINPDYSDAHNNLGVVFYELDKFDESVQSYERALVIDPEYAEAYNNLGVSLNKLGQLEEAVKSYTKALSINPNYADSYNNLGVVLKKLGQFDDAVKSYESALSINADDADTHNNLGIALVELDRLDYAAQSYNNAIAINPDLAEAHNNLGHVFSKLNKYLDSLKAYEKASLIKPDLNYVLGNILSGKMNSCNWHNLPNLLIETRKRINENKKVIDPFTLFGLIDDPALTRKAIELRVNTDHPKSHILPKIEFYPKHKRIRIGYFSGDFRAHPVAYLTAELYEVHDRKHFEIFAFSLGPDTKDEMNLRIKEGVDHFHDVRLMSHKDIALLARSLEIDIAIDLAGLTAESRTDVFAMSAAPLQLSYIGFLGTMGADYYDYLIADPIMIPEKNQKYYSEKIIYLPSFQVNDSTEIPPEITFTRKDLGLPEKGFIFCCFNNTYKFTPAIFDSWARILKQVKSSVIIIFVNNDLSKSNLAKEITLRGIDSSRLIFGDSLARPDYLARYRAVDLFLDTHPYNAGTTASDALRMGLPMITYIGKSYQARMGASILSAINLPELITTSIKEYESLAIELANNPDKFKIIKDKLFINIRKAPLYDTKLFTKNLESAYTTMYERYHQGLEPDYIYVEE